MATVSFELPDTAYATLRRAPDELSSEIRLAAVLFWYSRGVVSQGRAAELAGLTRAQFIEACFRNQVEAIDIDFDELRRESSK
ncbi:MAG TPA: UPF0175 family protein [Tepidisphaeraceae bacterium]